MGDGGATPRQTTWRVRAWIRVVSVVAWLSLLAQQFSTLHFVARGEMPAGEARDGSIALVAGALIVLLLVFRPSISVDGSQVSLRGPLRKAEFNRSEVVEVAPTGWGLRFTLRDGTRHTSIVCQNTGARSEPRWFDVAEAVTGQRPASKAFHHTPDER